jgi:transposase-like protein
MAESRVRVVADPESEVADPLHAPLRTGARRLIAEAVEAELADFLGAYADGIFTNVRLDDRLCLLLIVGVTAHGRKELVAV